MRHASSDGAGAGFCVCDRAGGLDESGTACGRCEGRGLPDCGDPCGCAGAEEPYADADEACDEAPCAAASSDDVCASAVDSTSPVAAARADAAALLSPCATASAAPPAPSSAG